MQFSRNVLPDGAVSFVNQEHNEIDHSLIARRVTEAGQEGGAFALRCCVRKESVIDDMGEAVPRR